MASGPDVLGTLPTLRTALAGAGPLLLPYPADGTALELPTAWCSGVAEPPLPAGGVALATSGSSGTGKRAVLSAAALLASANGTHKRLGGPGQWLLAVPAGHVAGLMVLVRSLVADREPVPLAAGRFTVAAFAAAADRLGPPPRYTAVVPAQLARLLAVPDGLTALRRFDAILVGGGPLPEPTRELARQHQVPVVLSYGMSETCGGCVYDGAPLPGVRVAVESAADGTGPGRIRLSGPALADGYLDAPELSRQAFRPDAAGTVWLHTDDVGTLDDFGRLTVTGRTDDVLISGGVKVWPTQVESSLLGVLPVGSQVAVVGLDDAEWGHLIAAAIVLPDTAPVGSAAAVDLATLRDRLRSRLPAAALPRRVRVLPRLPLIGVGKPDRAVLRSLLGGQRWNDGEVTDRGG